MIVRFFGGVSHPYDLFWVSGDERKFRSCKMSVIPIGINVILFWGSFGYNFKKNILTIFLIFVHP